MPNHPLFYPIHDESRSPVLGDQIQMALAIADMAILRSLLINCIPAIAQSHRLGEVSIRISVPTGEHRFADGVLYFEAIQCVQVPPTGAGSDRPGVAYSHQPHHYQNHPRTQWQTDLLTLGDGLSRHECEQLLLNAEFSPQEVQHILHLPCDAWYKSWWCMVDLEGNFTELFLRSIRTRRYPDGTFILQYKDSFQNEQPPCFRSKVHTVLIAVKADGQGFSETLQRINVNRQFLKASHVVLICNTISELEAQGFINQGVSLYPANGLLLPKLANCQICYRRQCVMNGQENSPVVLCHGFAAEAQEIASEGLMRAPSREHGKGQS